MGGSPEGSASPLVGRDAELAAVQGLIEAVRSGTGGALFLQGGAGLGKTSVLAVATRLASASGVRVLRARGLLSEHEFPLGVVHQLLDRVVVQGGGTGSPSVLDGSAGLAVGALTGSAVVPLPALLHGLYWLVANLSDECPLLVCVDDVDAADAVSLRFLAYLADRLEDLPVGLLLTARPAVAGEEPAVTAVRAALVDARRTLRPLTSDQVADLVIQYVPDAGVDFAQACVEVTGGNPFYVREVMRAIQRQDLEATAPSPERLREFGAAAVHRGALVRIARSGAEAIRLVRAMAILVDGAPLYRAATLAGLDTATAARAADVLAALGVIAVEEGQVAFVHALVRQSVYADLPEAQRAVEHGRGARILAAEDGPEDLLTAHLLRALPHGDPWTVQMLRAAAARALAVGAPEAAARHLRRALAEPPTPAARPGLVLDLGRAETAAGHPDAVAHLTEALAINRDPESRSAGYRSLAAALAAGGRRREAAEALEALLDEVPAGSERHGKTMADYLVNAMFEPQVRQRALCRADDLRRRPPSGRSADERRLLALLAVRSGQRAEPAADTVALMLASWQDGLLLSDEGPGGSGWLMTVWAAELAERTDLTLQVTAAVIGAAQRAGSVDAFATASYFQAVARRQRGQLIQAQADLEQALRAESAGWHRYAAACRVQLVERGLLADARGVLAELPRETGQGSGVHAGQTGSAQGMLEFAWQWHARGLLALAERRFPEALRLLQRTGEVLRADLGVDHTVMPWSSDAALAAIACGRRDLADELVQPLYHRAERSDLPLSLCRCLRVLGLVASGAEGLDLLHRAADVAQRAGDPVGQAEALTDIGAALRRCGRQADCRSPLRQAMELSTACGAEPVAHRARQELAAAGSRPRSTARTGRDALTPSELRVSEMAATGLTNKQIAQALFVSEKTVEYHLRHVFDKLGITRRAELTPEIAVPPVPGADAAGNDRSGPAPVSPQLVEHVGVRSAVDDLVRHRHRDVDDGAVTREAAVVSGADRADQDRVDGAIRGA
jgi:DNA-binding CsgD family transcriptional regulator